MTLGLAVGGTMSRYLVLLWARALVVACAAGPVWADPPPPERDGGLITSRIEKRVLKAFDFDERKLGNYETMPRGWRQIREPAYPRFLTPRFDVEVGHTAPPSFRFTLAGGSLGATYLARDIDVYPDAEYQVVCWIRSVGLVHARARLTACYMDHAFHKIVESETASACVGGKGQNDAWVQVSIRLPAGFEKARWIGLSCLVEQSAHSSMAPDDLRPIDHRDVRATVWFDDIVVLRLPRVSLEAGGPAGLFASDAPAECVARVADITAQDVSAKLEVVDGEGRTLQSHAMPVVGLEEAGVKLSFGKLSAGWYKAVLSADVGEGIVLKREQPFVQLSPDLQTPPGPGVGFGLILDDPVATDPRVCERLLSVAACGILKIPLWRRDLDDAAVLNGDSSLNQLLGNLRGRGVTLVGVLEEPPDSLARLCGHPKLSLMEVLSRPPEQWRPYLAFVSAHYGRQFAAWQVGADDDSVTGEGAMLARAVANVRAELKPLIGSAELAVPRPISVAEGAAGFPEAEIVSVRVPQYALRDLIAKPSAGAGEQPSPRKWAVVEPLPAGRYGRRSRLSTLARGMVVARVSGYETVFVRQPWSVTGPSDETIVSPEEDLIVIRTLSQALGGLQPVTAVWLGYGLRAWLFADAAGTQGVIVAWAEGEGDDQPVRASVDLGSEARQIDLWGNVTELSARSEGVEVVVGEAPTIIAQVRPSRIRTLASFGMCESALQAGIDRQRRVVTLTNPQSIRLHGTLALDPPAGWRIKPMKRAIDLGPGEEARVEVDVLVPTNQAVGGFVLGGRLSAEGEEPFELSLMAPVSVESAGLDVTVLTRREGTGVEVFQRVTNRTQEHLNLRSLLIAPDCPRQSRPIRNLPPGDTAIRRYRIENAGRLVGKAMRISAEQISGPLRHNALIVLD